MSTKQEKRAKKLAKKYKNLYLKEIGEKSYLNNFYLHDTDDKKLKLYEQQQKNYGFDERETWNMDTVFAEWLYSHLCMFKEKANPIISLTFHKFEYNGKTYTQKEIIHKMKKNLKYYLKHGDDLSIEKSKKAYDKLKEATELWAISLHTMGW